MSLVMEAQGVERSAKSNPAVLGLRTPLAKGPCLTLTASSVCPARPCHKLSALRVMKLLFNPTYIYL